MSKYTGKGLSIGSAGQVFSVGAQTAQTAKMPSAMTIQSLTKQLNGNILGSNAGWNTISLADVFTDNQYVKKREVYSLTEDVITLAVAVQRLRKTNVTTYYRLTDEKLFSEITDADRVLTQQIRDYYGKKAIVWKLKNNHISNFRNELIDLLNSDGKNVTEQFFGMAWYLPNFYEYDVQMDQLKEELGLPVNADKYISHERKSRLIKVEPLRMIERKSKTTHRLNYWFKVNDEIGGCINLDPNNELLSMFNHFFYNNKSMMMEARTNPQDLDNYKYVKLFDYKIVG